MITMMEQPKELTAEDKQAIANYRPPKVRMGQQVVFWPRGVRNSGEEALGWVWNNRNRRNIEVYVPHTGGENIHTGVFFIEDPRLEQGPEVRENGAWDFSEDQKARQAEVDEIRDRIEALELTTLAGGLRDRKFLYGLAKRLGFDGAYSQMRSEDLRKELLTLMMDKMPHLIEGYEQLEQETSDPAPETFDAGKVAKDLDY